MAAGLVFKSSTFDFGPLVGFAFDQLRSKAYVESGAVGGNIAMPSFTSRNATLAFGGEGTYDFGPVIGYGRATYNWQINSKTKTAKLSLASAQADMGTVSVNVPASGENFAEIGVGIQGVAGPALWNLGYATQIGAKDSSAHLVRVGVGLGF